MAPASHHPFASVHCVHWSPQTMVSQRLAWIDGNGEVARVPGQDQRGLQGTRVPTQYTIGALPSLPDGKYHGNN